jgi:hypothetical protein
MTLSIDTRLLERTVRDTEARFNAVRVTLTDPGEGEVIVSKRPKLPSERASKRKGRKGRKAVHGRLIAYELQRRGRDAFRYPPRVQAQALEYFQRNFTRAINKAYRSGRKQDKGVQRSLMGASMMLAYGAIQNIKQGGLGRNTGNYARRKPHIVKGISGTQQNRPYGWLSGRFIGEYPGAPGIRARVRNRARRSPNTRRPTRMPRNVYQR